MDWVSRFYNVNYVTLLLQNITAGQSYIPDLTLANIFCWGVQGPTLADLAMGGVRLRPRP